MAASTERAPHGLWAGILLVLAAATVLHWPAGAVFKADDYAILHYVSDWGRALSDLVGPQYDLDLFRFWRPLITLSFAIDARVFGAEPFGYYAMSVVALGVAAALLVTLVRALVPGRHGIQAGLVTATLWICSPATVASQRCWAAGRVDTYLAPALLLALVLHVRARRGASRVPALMAALVALGIKEPGIGFALLALGIDLLDPRPAAYGRRFLGRALPALPYLLLIPVYFAWRKLALGGFIGGYRFAPEIDAGATPLGVLRLIGSNIAPGTPAAVQACAAVLLVLGLAVAGLRGNGRLRRTAALVLIGAGLFGPLAGVVASTGQGSWRLAYLPSVAVLFVWAAAWILPFGFRGAVCALALLALLLPERFRTRAEFDEHDRVVASVQAAVLRCDRELPRGQPVVVTGDTQSIHHVYRLMWGLAAIGKPPFLAKERTVVTLRPFLGPVSMPIPEATALAGLVAWVRIDGGRARLVRGERAPRGRAETLGFDGTFHAAMLGAEPAAGWQTQPIEGPVIVATGTGALAFEPRVEDGRLPLGQVLSGDPFGAASPYTASMLEMMLLFLGRSTWWTPPDRFAAGDLLWTAADLDKDSPFVLFWRSGGRTWQAELRLGPGFAKAYRDARW